MEYHIRLILYSKLVNSTPEIILRDYDLLYSQWIKDERLVWCSQTKQVKNGCWTVDQNNLFDQWLCNRWDFKPPIVRESIKGDKNDQNAN
jgi:glycerophosphoryl diester phosphodiesterase